MLPVAVVMDTPLDTCVAYNTARDHPVPEPVIRGFHALMVASIPHLGPVPGFAITRRIGPGGADTTLYDERFLPHWRAAHTRGEPWTR